MTDQQLKSLADRLLKIADRLIDAPEILDTLWVSDGVTVVDELHMIASELGATDEEIEANL